jgi:hypothetical protein
MMNKRVLFESFKAILIGASVGFIIMFFTDSNSFKAPILCSLFALSFHARNNAYQSKKTKNK